MSSLKHERYLCLTYYCVVFCSLYDMALSSVEDISLLKYSNALRYASKCTFETPRSSKLNKIPVAKKSCLYPAFCLNPACLNPAFTAFSVRFS